MKYFPSGKRLFFTDRNTAESQNDPLPHPHSVLTPLIIFPFSFHSTCDRNHHYCFLYPDALGSFFSSSLSLFLSLFTQVYWLVILSFVSYLQPALVTRFDLAYPSVTTANYMASFMLFYFLFDLWETGPCIISED